MNKTKIRFSIPGKIIDSLWNDDKFFQEISKIKKIESNFPRYDQWKDDTGFHLTFALAGYSSEDLLISFMGQSLIISAKGLEKLDSAQPEPISDEEVLLSDLEVKTVNLSLSRGFVSRGIARRSFKLSLYISEEFNLAEAKANMENGLLYIYIPHKEIEEQQIKINKGE